MLTKRDNSPMDLVTALGVLYDLLEGGKLTAEENEALMRLLSHHCGMMADIVAREGQNETEEE